MKKTYVIGGAAVLTAALLAGCNSNGDDGSVPAVRKKLMRQHLLHSGPSPRIEHQCPV